MASSWSRGSPPKHAHAWKRRQGLLQILQMGGAADAVKDHPRQVQGGVEAGEAVHQGRGAPGHGPGVHHQQHRQPQPLGHLGRGPGLAGPVIAVEQPHHPFHHRHVGAPGLAAEQGQIGLPAQHPAVQVPADAARGPGVMPGVDKIRPHLEGLHGQTPAGQGIQEPQGDGGLAHPALSPGDYQPARLVCHDKNSVC